MSITGAGSAGQTLKQMMEAHKAKITDMLDGGMAKVKSGMEKQVAAANALGSLGDKVEAEGDDLLASIGQFTNELG